MSCNDTMLACFKSLRSDTSLIAVHGAPSSCSNRISFKATNFPVILERERERERESYDCITRYLTYPLRPLYTVAYVPCHKKMNTLIVTIGCCQGYCDT